MVGPCWNMINNCRKPMICDLSWSGFAGHDNFSDLGDLDAFAWSGPVALVDPLVIQHSYGKWSSSI